MHQIVHKVDQTAHDQTRHAMFRIKKKKKKKKKKFLTKWNISLVLNTTKIRQFPESGNTERKSNLIKFL